MSEPEPPARAPSWQFEYAWKWFEIHVTYRAQMQNYLMVAAGVFAVAYVTALTGENPEPRLAGAVAALGTIVVFSFFIIDIVTNEKIQNAKRVLLQLMEQPTSPRCDLWSLFGGHGGTRLDEGFTNQSLRDPIWTATAEGSLITGFAIAGAYGFGVSPIITVVGGAFVVLIVAAIAVRTSVASAKADGLLYESGRGTSRSTTLPRIDNGQ